MADPFTLRVTTEYTPITFGWWLVIEDPAVPEGKNVFSIPINGHPDNNMVLYPLLGVGFEETEQIAPRRISDQTVLKVVQYALDQAVSKGEPLSETALNLLNWVSSLPAQRTA